MLKRTQSNNCFSSASKLIFKETIKGGNQQTLKKGNKKAFLFPANIGTMIISVKSPLLLRLFEKVILKRNILLKLNFLFIDTGFKKRKIYKNITKKIVNNEIKFKNKHFATFIFILYSVNSQNMFLTLYITNITKKYLYHNIYWYRQYFNKTVPFYFYLIIFKCQVFVHYFI